MSPRSWKIASQGLMNSEGIIEMRQQFIGAVFALLTALSLPALSQAAGQRPSDTVTPRGSLGMPMMNGSPTMHGGGSMMQDFDRSIDARIRELHSKLKITPAQEEQWSTLADVMRANAVDMEKLVNQTASGTAVVQLHRYETMAQAHLDGLKKFIPSFGALYDTLSAEQRTTADSLFRARMGRHSRAGGQG